MQITQRQFFSATFGNTSNRTCNFLEFEHCFLNCVICNTKQGDYFEINAYYPINNYGEMAIYHICFDSQTDYNNALKTIQNDATNNEIFKSLFSLKNKGATI